MYEYYDTDKKFLNEPIALSQSQQILRKLMTKSLHHFPKFE